MNIVHAKLTFAIAFTFFSDLLEIEIAEFKRSEFSDRKYRCLAWQDL